MSREATEQPPLEADDIQHGGKAEAGFRQHGVQFTGSVRKESSPSSGVTQDSPPCITQDSSNNSPQQITQAADDITLDHTQTTHDLQQHITQGPEHIIRDHPQTVQDPPLTIQNPHIIQDNLQAVQDVHLSEDSPQTTRDLSQSNQDHHVNQDHPQTTQDPCVIQDHLQTVEDPRRIQNIRITQDHLPVVQNPDATQDYPQTVQDPQVTQARSQTVHDPEPEIAPDHPQGPQHITPSQTGQNCRIIQSSSPKTLSPHQTDQDPPQTPQDHPHSAENLPPKTLDRAHVTQDQLIQDHPHATQNHPHITQDLPHTSRDLTHKQNLALTSHDPTTHITPEATHVTQEEEIKKAPEPVKSTSPLSREDMTKDKHKESPTQAGEDAEDEVILPPSVDHGRAKPFVDPSHERVVAPTAEVESIGELFDVDIDDDGSLAGRAPVGSPTAKKSQVSYHQKRGSKDQEPGPLTVEELEIPGRDEPDSGSAYSFYMESDFRYYFQHPYVRLFIAYFVTFCNFLIYAEDPVAHSRTECNIPVIGNSFAFVFTRYPPNAWSVLKVVLWLVGLAVGLIVGKLFFHTFLFNKLFRLKMFFDDKGSWMTMFLCTILCIFICSNIYNLFLMIGGDSTSEYRISPYMSIANHIFMKAAATGTWCGDFFTAWMVTDMMLQEKLYPMWALRPRQWWNTGYRRIILFWIVVFISSFIVIFVIATDYINWDRLNHDFLHTNELSRAFLASFILVMDIIIVMQDWDFPHFIGAIDIKLPGINTAHIRFKIPRLLRKLEYWHVHISGKWFNYGILFVVIILDLNMWKNQIFYAPLDYGQYIDSDDRIHSVNDEFSVNNANETIISFAYRNSTIDPITGKRYIELDNIMNARYHGYALGVKAIAFIPSISIFIVFGVLVWVYGRMPKPTKDDPYGGRLKRRQKRRFSMRVGWKRMRKRFRSTPSVLAAIQAFKDGLRKESEKVEEEEGLDVARKVVDRWKNTAHGENGDGAGPSHQDEPRQDAKQELNMDVTEV